MPAPFSVSDLQTSPGSPSKIPNSSSLEASGARSYWSAIAEILPQELGFVERVKPAAHDLVNVMLNYAYGVLSGQTEKAIHYAGLDPYTGYLHADRSGKASLVYDLMEEFRQPVADRPVLSLRGTEHVL